MAVYVDNFNAPYRNMVMCHMIADTTEELLEMVDKIGVQRKWIQHPGTANEHFDIATSKKKLAIAAGAIEINFRDYAQIVEDRKFGEPFETHIEAIWCPGCLTKRYGVVVHKVPFWSYVHKCRGVACGHITMESDWQKVEE